MHGVVVLLVLLVLDPHASNIPLASMAPILMVVAWNMSVSLHIKKVVPSAISAELKHYCGQGP
ncbi:hypothetical protein AMD01_01045 [Priestia koreensis]|uniref:Uncharacterized protein n=1 Tax=Priestia koreensis TaxID=284581 RepID=A0A0M0LH43_9BACI|nr:hypothetical protein AMD01_01045 [Priestia koreensis]